MISNPEGKVLLEMTGWSMSVPTHKDGNAAFVNDKRPSDPPFFQRRGEEAESGSRQGLRLVEAQRYANDVGSVRLEADGAVLPFHHEPRLILSGRRKAENREQSHNNTNCG